MALDPEPLTITATLAIGPARIRGARKERCSVCKRDVWIAPSSVALAKLHATVVVKCIPCSGTDLEVMRLRLADAVTTDAQRAELIRAGMAPDDVDAMFAALGLRNVDKERPPGK